MADLAWSKSSRLDERPWGDGDACRDQAREDGEPLDGFDRVIAFVHAPPCNAGARSSPGDAVLDQGGWLPYFQHEIGHVLGFEHSFGPGGPYDDPYCVMGYTNTQSHRIEMPTDFSGVTMLKGADFWQSERVLSGASLYRYLPDFANSDRVGRVDISQGAHITLTSLSEGHWGGLLLAVVPAEVGDLTVEYRTRSLDDAGVSPAVVVHSIGRRFFDAGHEVDPVWFEAAIDPVTSTVERIGHDLELEVTSSGGREVSVYLTRPA